MSLPTSGLITMSQITEEAGFSIGPSTSNLNFLRSAFQPGGNRLNTGFPTGGSGTPLSFSNFHGRSGATLQLTAFNGWAVTFSPPATISRTISGFSNLAFQDVCGSTWPNAISTSATTRLSGSTNLNAQVLTNNRIQVSTTGISAPGTFSAIFESSINGGIRRLQYEVILTVSSMAAVGAVVNPLGFNGQTFSSSGEGFDHVIVTFNTNGTAFIDAWNAGQMWAGNWFSPTTTSIGNSYWIRFTLNSTSGSGADTTWTTTTGALQLNSARAFSVTASASHLSFGGRNRTANYTVHIATDSGMTNIVSTSTVSISAAASAPGAIPP